MQRPQKMTKVSCLYDGMLETESSKGACSITKIGVGVRKRYIHKHHMNV